MPLPLEPVRILAGALPFLFLFFKRKRRLAQFAKQLPEALELISRALRAGHSLASGFKLGADEMSNPINIEFERCYESQNLGVPLEDAIEQMTERVPNLDLRFFATAVILQRQTGGDLAEILDKIGYIVRERFKILRQVRVHTAHGRFTGYVLLALPAALGIILSYISPDHMNTLFTEPQGKTMLLGAGVMQCVGYIWIRNVIKIEV